MKVRIALWLSSFVASAIIGAVILACSSLTAADKRAIAIDAIQIGVCQEKGRACKRSSGADCFGVYDACIIEAGLREGSAR